MPEQHYFRTHPMSHVPIIHPAMLLDDCSATFIWLSAGDGADWTAEYDPSAAHAQLNGILLQTRETSPAIDDVVTIARRIWLPPLRLLRLQAVFSTVAVTPDAYLYFRLDWYDSVTLYSAGLRFHVTTAAVAYISARAGGEPVWTDITDFDYNLYPDTFNKLDLSVNIYDNFYHLIHVNEHFWDCRAIPIGYETDATGKHLLVTIELQTLVAEQATAYVDQLLLTPENP